MRVVIEHVVSKDRIMIDLAKIEMNRDWYVSILVIEISSFV